jgi:hypothetical protein
MTAGTGPSEGSLNQDDAIRRALSHAQAAERLLAGDETSETPAGRRDDGPYGVHEQQRAARHTEATAHAALAQAWAMIAPHLQTIAGQQIRAAEDRRRSNDVRRSTT